MNSFKLRETPALLPVVPRPVNAVDIAEYVKNLTEAAGLTVAPPTILDPLWFRNCAGAENSLGMSAPVPAQCVAEPVDVTHCRDVGGEYEIRGDVQAPLSRRCYLCRGTLLWRKRGTTEWICDRCHRPSFPELAEEWRELFEESTGAGTPSPQEAS